MDEMEQGLFWFIVLEERERVDFKIVEKPKRQKMELVGRQSGYYEGLGLEG